MDHTAVTLQSTPYLPLSRSSPEGVTTRWTVIAPADKAYYSFIDPVRMKGWVGLVDWPTADGLPIQNKWLPISCRSGADQWKFTGQRPTFYHWATQSIEVHNSRRPLDRLTLTLTTLTLPFTFDLIFSGGRGILMDYLFCLLWLSDAW